MHLVQPLHASGPAAGMGQERRLHQRMEIKGDVRLWADEGTPPFAGDIINISGSGILLRCQRTFDAGQTLTLEVMSSKDRKAGLEKPMKGKIRVVRVKGDEPPYEIAATFLELSFP